jgi:hypothetical protein
MNKTDLHLAVHPRADVVELLGNPTVMFVSPSWNTEWCQLKLHYDHLSEEFRVNKSREPGRRSVVVYVGDQR